MDSKKLHKVYTGLVSAGLPSERAMQEAVRICGGAKPEVRLNSTAQAMYDSLVELGGEGKLGAIIENCRTDLPGTNGGRIAYSTASYTMANLVAKELVRRVGEGSQAFYVVA